MSLPSRSSAPATSASSTRPAWPTSVTPSSASTSTRRRSTPSPPARRRSSSPACPSCWPGRWPPAGCASPPTSPRSPRRRRALRLRRHPAAPRASTPPTLRYVDAAGRLAGPAPAPADALVVGKSTVPVGTAARLRELLRRARPPARRSRLAWNPEFLREGFAVEDTAGTRTGSCTASPGRPPRPTPPCWTRCTPRPLADRHAAPGHRLRHRRAGQGRRQRVPGHQDLVHQRDGRGLRGRRRRRRRARRRDRPRRPDRRASSSAPASASAAAACPRTSARSWPAPASSAPTRP